MNREEGALQPEKSRARCKGRKKPVVLEEPCGVNTVGTEESPGEHRLETTNFEGLHGQLCVR